jgi:RNA polymerase sigma-70 factor (ECF subfamily)
VKFLKTSYKLYNDEQLMLLIIKSKDEVAFGTLYDRYAQKLTTFCNRMLQSKEHSEDLVHEVFIKIIENPHAFDAQLKFSTWAYTIAHNLCLNAIRNGNNRHKLLKENYIQAQETFIQHKMDATTIKSKINELFIQLSEKEKAVFVLRFEHELSIKEIATIMVIPVGSVKSCLFYLLKKFNMYLTPYTEK